MFRRKQQSASSAEFNRGKSVAYRDCGLPFREIGSVVGRNQTTVMWVCDRWMQEAECQQDVHSLVWGGIGYLSRTPLVRIAGTLNSQRYISEVLEPAVLPCLQRLSTAIFQQPARSPDLSSIENMWYMVAQRLTQITPSAAAPDQLWQRLEAALGLLLLYPKNTSKVSLNQCRGMWQR
ncbi:transposable element Tcb1 transposase [Trichonephila clavipes]|nr:transposable element Tcb1 transposase [Trichonephila clavipes]